MKYQAIILLVVIFEHCSIECYYSPYNGFLFNDFRYKRRTRFLRGVSSSMSSPEKVYKFLYNDYETRATEICNKNVKAEWAHVTDLDDQKKEEQSLNATLEKAHFDKEVYLLYVKDLDIHSIDDPNLVRQLRKLSNIDYAALSVDSLAKLMKILDDMEKIYSTAKICPFTKPKCDIAKEGLSFTPDIETIMANSSDYDELLYTWVSFHDATGGKLKKYYEMYVILSNQAAVANNFSDHGAMWRDEYESENLEQQVDDLWHEVEPLYKELHQFVRTRLKEVYVKEMSEDDGLIPAHLLGNMWAQNWINIKGLVIPFPEEPEIDLEEVFIEKKIVPLKMFDIANDFYVSLGLPSMQDSYDTRKGAIIEKVANRSMVCHASAWDFCDGQDFRVKMCTQVDYQDFVAIHHELGHVQYFMQYKDQPILYRSGANPAFHEAIGDTMALSVISPGHMIKIGLFNPMNVTFKREINALMNMALERIAFLPYSLLLGKWRWDVLGERIDPDNWNEHYWRYREKYQRVKAPLVRSNEDFDPGAKFHVPSDTQYISYFIAHILQFQIHKGLCKYAGLYFEEDPKSFLHRCDLYGSHTAGKRLQSGLQLGSSRHWSHVLEKLTGESELSSLGLVEFFTPLYQFLKNANNQLSENPPIS